MKHISFWALGALALSLFAVRAEAAEQEILIKYFDLTEGRIAFSYESKSKREIYVLDFATLDSKPVADTEGAENPRFSPDGTKLAFSSGRSGDHEIYVVSADGSGIRQLTTSAGKDDDPDWSPDGKQLVYSSARSGTGTDIYIMDSDGTNQTALMKSTKANTNPRWNPAGTSIIFVTNEYWPGQDLLLYDRGTKKITILSTGYISSLQPAWDLSGNQFAFVFGPVDDPDIWVQGLDGAKGEAIIQRAGKDVAPEWMDKGKQFLFLGEMDPDSGHYEIFMHTMGGKEPIQLTETNGTIRGLSWSPISPTKKKPNKPAADATPVLK